jgi:hypothetical protein
VEFLHSKENIGNIIVELSLWNKNITAKNVCVCVCVCVCECACVYLNTVEYSIQNPFDQNYFKFHNSLDLVILVQAY